MSEEDEESRIGGRGFAVGVHQPLTFQPALDDRARLSAYLRNIVSQYNARKDEVIASSPQSPTEKERVKNDKQGYSSNPRHPAEPQKPAAGTKRRRARFDPKTKQNVSPASLKQPPNPSRRRKTLTPTTKASSPRRRLKTWPAQSADSPSTLDETSRATIKRVKAQATMDVNAPDPEQDSPPEETEDERRRRKERINGRRKRARKTIELNQMHNQVLDLSELNRHLREENKIFRERLDLAKGIITEGGTVTAEFLCFPSAPEDPESSREEEEKEGRQGSVPLGAPGVPRGIARQARNAGSQPFERFSLCQTNQALPQQLSMSLPQTTAGPNQLASQRLSANVPPYQSTFPIHANVPPYQSAFPMHSYLPQQQLPNAHAASLLQRSTVSTGVLPSPFGAVHSNLNLSNQHSNYRRLALQQQQVQMQLQQQQLTAQQLPFRQLGREQEQTAAHQRALDLQEMLAQLQQQRHSSTSQPPQSRRPEKK